MDGTEVTAQVRAELAPTGVLRAGINLSNFLLVSGEDDSGDPVGVSPDTAREIARRLDVDMAFVTYPDPAALADAAQDRAWDIGNIGAEPQRAEFIAFTPAYCEIEATYMVPRGSQIETLAQVDQPGVRIATKRRAAYGLWLENNIEHAALVRTDSIDRSFEVFVEQGLEALAGLRPRLIQDVQRLEGARILDGQFSAVQQAIGTPCQNTAAARWLRHVVAELIESGFVAGLIEAHDVRGLSVAPVVP